MYGRAVPFDAVKVKEAGMFSRYVLFSFVKLFFRNRKKALNV